MKTRESPIPQATPYRYGALLILQLILLMSLVSRAEATDTNIPAPSPQQVVAHTIEDLQAVLSKASGKLGDDPSELMMALDQVISHNVDIPRVTRLSLRNYWAGTTDGQKEQLVTLLHRFMLRLITLMIGPSAFSGDSGANVTFLPARINDNNGDHALVRTVVSSKDGDEMHVNYHLCKDQGAWKIYDVAVDGVSFRPVQASIYSVAHQHGIDGLIARLEEKVNKAKGEQEVSSFQLPQRREKLSPSDMFGQANTDTRLSNSHR